MSVCLNSLKKTNHIELKIRVVKSSKEIIHSCLCWVFYLQILWNIKHLIPPVVVVLAVGLSKCGLFLEAHHQDVVIFRWSVKTTTNSSKNKIVSCEVSWINGHEEITYKWKITTLTLKCTEPFIWPKFKVLCLALLLLAF